jgi:hypothetical protein
MTKELIKKRLEEFEEEFPSKDFLSLGLGGNIPLEPVSREAIKFFLKDSMEMVVSEVRERIKKNKYDHKEGEFSDYGKDDYNRGRQAGHLYALDDLLTFLDEEL